MESLILLLTGCIGGLLSGLFGIGGGVIYVIVFQAYFQRNFPQYNGHTLVEQVIANSILAVCFGSFSGVIRQIKLKNFYPKEVLLTGMGALLTGITATWWIHRWESFDKSIFFILFTVFLLPILIKVLPSKAKTQENLVVSNVFFFITGLITGICTAFTGLGGGVVVNPMLHGIKNYPIKRSFSIAQGVMMMTTLVITLYNYWNATIHQQSIFNLSMLIPVVVGVVFMAPIGVSLAQKISAMVLQKLFVIFAILIIGYNLIQIYQSWHLS